MAKKIISIYWDNVSRYHHFYLLLVDENDFSVLLGPKEFNTDVSSADDLYKKKHKVQQTIDKMIKSLEKVKSNHVIDLAIIKTVRVGYSETGELSTFVDQRVTQYLNKEKIEYKKIRGALEGKAMEKFQNALDALDLMGNKSKRRDWLSWMTVLQVTPKALDKKIRKLYKMAKGVSTWTKDNEMKFEEFRQTLGLNR